MTMFLAPYTAIADIDGSPLDAGFLYLGEYGKDPELFPIEVFWDADFTVPAAQPIRTRNGYPMRNGSPAKVYLQTAQHSIAIKNSKGAFILVDFFNKGWDASFVVDASGKTQQEINDVVISQTLTTEQFKIQIPETDDTGRLQRAFDVSYDRQQTLYLVGDFECSNTIYARHSFDGSSSTITYPTDYAKEMLVFAAEKSLTTTVRNSNKKVSFPSILTTKTSGTNVWDSNVGSCAIKIINAQECMFNFSETRLSEYGVYLLAYNTDANYNTYNFGRHVYHKRPLTIHINGETFVASMNQNTFNGGRFAVNTGAARITGIYLVHALITGTTPSSCNNNVFNNPSVEGYVDECAMRFENLSTGTAQMSYNTIISPRLESGSVAGKKILFTGLRVRWNQVLYGYGVDYTTVLSENSATSNNISSAVGGTVLGGSSGTTSSLSLQNTSSVDNPVFAVFSPSLSYSSFADAATNASMYMNTNQMVTRSGGTADRFKLTFASGKMEWGSSAIDTNLYRSAPSKLKTDGAMEFGAGIGLFGTTSPTAKRSITGLNVPTNITEQNTVINSIVAALVAFGLVTNDRT